MEKTYKSENRIQQECIMWFHNEYPDLRGCLFHVPNGGARSIIEGKLFKQIGVYPGVSDLLLMYNKETICFELKNKFGIQSSRQKKWQQLICNQGFNYYIIRNLKEFIAIIEIII